MARGDIIVFNQTLLDIGRATYDFSAHTFRLGLITGIVTPSIDTPDPRWGPAGGTNFSAAQVSTGTAYAGPVAATNVTYSVDAGQARFDFDDVSINKDEIAGFSNARWGVLYNDSAAGKNALLAIDLGSEVSNIGSLLLVRPNPAGMFVIRRAAA